MGFARERLSLLGKFSVLSALAVGVLALVVGQVLQRQMQQRALAQRG
jgi:hypothetical protein